MVQQLHSIEVSAGPRPLEFLLSEASFHRSRENVIYAAGDKVLAGMLVGQILVDTAPAEDHTGNTGNGVLTFATPAVGAGLAAGDYRVVMTGGTHTVAQAFSGVGNGVLTLATPAFGSGVKDGAYQVVFIAAAANGGTFIVEDPNGIEIGAGSVGVAFQAAGADVRFTIADGSTDFAVGDRFTLTVSPAVAGSGLSTFDVYNPTGVKVQSGTVGTAYDHALKFTIADGATNFAVGDEFTITVESGGNTYAPWDPDETNGAQTIKGISGYAYLNETYPVDGLMFARDCEVKGPLVIWGMINATITDDQRATAEQALTALGIRVRW